MTFSIRTLAAILALMSLVQGRGEAGGVIWAGTNLGPYLSSDNGATWEPLAANLGTPHPFLKGVPIISAIAIDPHDPSIVYLAALFPSGTSAVLRTSDGGATWTGVPVLGAALGGATPDGRRRTVLAVDPVASNVLYFQDVVDIYKSGDAGATWSKLGTAPQFATSKIAIDPSASGTLYVVAQDPASRYVPTIFKSADFGETWAAIAAIPGLPSSGYHGSLSVDPHDGRVLFLAVAGICGSQGQCGLFRSGDGGSTWRNLGLPGQFESVAFGSGAGDYYSSSGFLAGLGPVVLRSSDAGNIWNPAGMLPIASTSGAHLVVDPDNGSKLFAVTTSSSVSDDSGQTWSIVDVPPLCGPPAIDPCPFDTSWPATQYPDILAVAFPKPPPAAITNVSAASFRAGPLAPDSIASVLGQNLSTGTAAADTNPLPTTLAGTTVTIADSAGTSHNAQLFYVSPGQINYLIPASVAIGEASVLISSGDGTSVRQRLQVAPVSPGIFVLNRSGLAAATALRVSGGNQSNEDVYELDGSGAVVARPIDPGPPTDEVYLILYGTGFRAAGTGATTVTIGGEAVSVLYAGPQGAFAGLDQANILVPRSLAGRGEVELVLKAAGHESNAVRLTFAGAGGTQ